MLHDVRYLRHLIDAHERVHLRHERGQVVAKALREAAGDDERLAAVTRLADLRGFEDGIHAFLLRGVDERAGVDDDGVRLGGVIDDFDAGFQQRAEHDFGVHQVLGAAEGDESDAERTLSVFVAHDKRDEARRAARPWQRRKPV